MYLHSSTFTGVWRNSTFAINHRAALGLNDEARTEAALRGIVDKWLTYRDLSGGRS